MAVVVVVVVGVVVMMKFRVKRSHTRNGEAFVEL